MFLINYLFNFNCILIYKINIFIYFIFFYLFLFLFFYVVFALLLFRNFLKNFIILYKNIFFEYFLFIFFLILIFFFSILSTLILLKIRSSNNSIIIKLVSYQWKWYINYIYNKSKNICYFSNIREDIFKILNFKKKDINYILNTDNYIILPYKKKIKFFLFSNDVIHSLFIPNINIKKDLFNNHLRDFTLLIKKKLILNGYCTELCGKNHSFMPLNLKFIKFIEFKKWLLSKKFNIFYYLNY